MGLFFEPVFVVKPFGIRVDMSNGMDDDADDHVDLDAAVDSAICHTRPRVRSTPAGARLLRAGPQ